MVDLHTHSLFSDGGLLPTELMRRVDVLGHEYLAITDHADDSNLDWIIPRVIKATERVNRYFRLQTIAGIELTHVPPPLIPELVRESYAMGAQLVVIHGETLVEPVAEGTNLAAIQAVADILAHPGLIREEEARLAEERGVHLEISARKGHCLANGHVARMALKTGARLVLNTDAHDPSDLIDLEFARSVALGSGLSPDDFERMMSNSRKLAKKALARSRTA